MTEACMNSIYDFFDLIMGEIKCGRLPHEEGIKMFANIMARLIAEDKEEND